MIVQRKILIIQRKATQTTCTKTQQRVACAQNQTQHPGAVNAATPTTCVTAPPQFFKFAQYSMYILIVGKHKQYRQVHKSQDKPGKSSSKERITFGDVYGLQSSGSQTKAKSLHFIHIATASVQINYKCSQCRCTKIYGCDCEQKSGLQ